MVYASVHGTVRFHDSTESVVAWVAEAIARRDLAVDYVQVDAGWYRLLPNKLGKEAWAWSCGNWTPDPARYPNGMRAAADAARQRPQVHPVVEPERAMVGSETHREHPEFLIPPPPAYALPPEHRYMSHNGFHLLDLGNPDALAWAIATISAKINEWALDLYCHDFNLHPVRYWRHREADDRQGMNEIRYIMGPYEYFDALRREHPHPIIDSSASGVRRIDFEMLRADDHVLAQRLDLGPRAAAGHDGRPVVLGAVPRRRDQGRGLVQAFRPSRAEQQTLELPLRNLDPEAAYSVTDLDAPDRAVTTTGAQLMDERLSASVRALESALFVYEAGAVGPSGTA